MKTILLIDDCDDFRSLSTFLLLDSGYEVFDASSVEDAFSVLNQESIDLIVCDLHLNFSTDDEILSSGSSTEIGIHTVKELKKALPAIPIIALSNTSYRDLQRISKALGSVPAYTKPTQMDELVQLIDFHVNGNTIPQIH